jgi:hypothetical protein
MKVNKETVMSLLTKYTGTPTARRVLDQERIVGRRAPYHVYYKSAAGKTCVDPVYEVDSVEAAEEKLMKIASELRYFVRVIGTVIPEGPLS